jgi:hypothetical protein
MEIPPSSTQRLTVNKFLEEFKARIDSNVYWKCRRLALTTKCPRSDLQELYWVDNLEILKFFKSRFGSNYVSCREI